MTCGAVSSSAIARASGTDRASRSSLVTTSVAGAARSECLAQPRALAVGPGQPVVDVDPPEIDTERGERGALGSEVLLVGRDAVRSRLAHRGRVGRRCPRP